MIFEGRQGKALFARIVPGSVEFARNRYFFRGTPGPVEIGLTRVRPISTGPGVPLKKYRFLANSTLPGTILAKSALPCLPSKINFFWVGRVRRFFRVGRVRKQGRQGKALFEGRQGKKTG